MEIVSFKSDIAPIVHWSSLLKKIAHPFPCNIWADMVDILLLNSFDAYNCTGKSQWLEFS